MGNLFVSTNVDSSDEACLLDHNSSSSTSNKKRKNQAKSLPVVVNSFQRITFSNLKEHDKLHPHVNSNSNVPVTETLTDDSFSVVTNPLADYIVSGTVVAEGLSLFENLKANNLLMLESQRLSLEMQSQCQVSNILESHESESRRLRNASNDHIRDVENQSLKWEQAVKSLEASLVQLELDSLTKDFDIKDLQETLSKATTTINKVRAENREHQSKAAKAERQKANATLNVAASVRRLREKLSKEKHVIIYSLVGVADYDHAIFVRTFENDPDFHVLLSQIQSLSQLCEDPEDKGDGNKEANRKRTEAFILAHCLMQLNPHFTWEFAVGLQFELRSACQSDRAMDLLSKVMPGSMQSKSFSNMMHRLGAMLEDQIPQVQRGFTIIWSFDQISKRYIVKTHSVCDAKKDRTSSIVCASSVNYCQDSKLGILEQTVDSDPLNMKHHWMSPANLPEDFANKLSLMNQGIAELPPGSERLIEAEAKGFFRLVWGLYWDEKDKDGRKEYHMNGLGSSNNDVIPPVKSFICKFCGAVYAGMRVKYVCNGVGSVGKVCCSKNFKKEEEMKINLGQGDIAASFSHFRTKEVRKQPEKVLLPSRVMNTSTGKVQSNVASSVTSAQDTLPLTASLASKSDSINTKLFKVIGINPNSRASVMCVVSMFAKASGVREYCDQDKVAKELLLLVGDLGSLNHSYFDEITRNRRIILLPPELHLLKSVFRLIARIFCIFDSKGLILKELGYTSPKAQDIIKNNVCQRKTLSTIAFVTSEAWIRVQIHEFLVNNKSGTRHSFEDCYHATQDCKGDKTAEDAKFLFSVVIPSGRLLHKASRSGDKRAVMVTCLILMPLLFVRGHSPYALFLLNHLSDILRMTAKLRSFIFRFPAIEVSPGNYVGFDDKQEAAQKRLLSHVSTTESLESWQVAVMLDAKNKDMSAMIERNSINAATNYPRYLANKNKLKTRNYQDLFLNVKRVEVIIFTKILVAKKKHASCEVACDWYGNPLKTSLVHLSELGDDLVGLQSKNVREEKEVHGNEGVPMTKAEHTVIEQNKVNRACALKASRDKKSALKDLARPPAARVISHAEAMSRDEGIDVDHMDAEESGDMIDEEELQERGGINNHEELYLDPSYNETIDDHHDEDDDEEEEEEEDYT